MSDGHYLCAVCDYWDVVGTLAQTGMYLSFSHPPSVTLSSAAFSCVQLYCVSGASWALVWQRALWAMQINLFLTDVPCIFHIRDVEEMSRKFLPPPNRLLNPQHRSASPSLHPLSSPPAHLSTCTFPASIIEINGIDSRGVNGFCCQGEEDAL